MVRWLKLWAVLTASSSAALACSGAPSPPSQNPEEEPVTHGDRGLNAALAEARDGVNDAALAELLVDQWRWTLEQEPLFATRLGVHDFDARIEDNEKKAIDARRAERREFLERAKRIDRAKLGATDQVHVSLLIDLLEAQVAADEACAFEEWTLSPRDNPVTRWNHLRELHQVKTLDDANNLLARYRAIDKSIDNEIALLELGAGRGLYSTRESARRVLDITDKLLAKNVADWDMLEPAKVEHPDFPKDRLAAFRQELREVVAKQIQPALVRYANFLRTRILPKARPEEQSGLSSLPIGEACYRARIRQETTLPLEARAIHELGLAEIAKSDAAIAALGKKLFDTPTLEATLKKLRSDTSLYFQTAEQIEEAAKTSLALAKERIPNFFGVLPKADCVVRRIPDYEAPYTTIAYYRQPHPDGSKPGEYFVNIHEPKTRPRFEARVLAIHESIPGHHLQIAIAQELGGVPAFRKHEGVTAYVEGWALYTERLGEEMKLYENDLDRMGMLSFDAWRAGRLVVDTGIHALGWSRTQAKRYLEEHTALSPENIDNEVDRYISWPGQALGYKIGQLEIVKLREQAQKELGERFSIQGFHDVALTGGAVTLAVLRERVDAWIKERKSAR
jgi:uncharacterized protein (DUF885 family)